jgi:hypothetical protein
MANPNANLAGNAGAGQGAANPYMANQVTPQNYNPASSLFSMLMSQIAPEQQLGQAGAATDAGMLQAFPQLFGLQQGYLGAQYANQLGQYGIQGQQLGLSQLGLGQQGQYLGAQEQAAKQQYGIETGAGGTFALQGLQNRLAAANAQQQTSGQAAASGAIGSKGYQINTYQNALQNYMNQQGLKNTEQQAAISNQLQNSGFKYQQQQLQNQQAGLGLQGTTLGLEEGMAGANYGYQGTQNRIQGLQTEQGDLSSLLQQLSGMAGNVTNAGSSLGLLQGLPMATGAPTQPNTGN